MLNRIALAVALACYGLFAGSMWLANAGVIDPVTGLAGFALGAVLGMVSTGFGLAVLFRTQVWPIAMVALSGSLPFMVLIAGAVDSLRYPPINDIATNPRDPLAFEAAAALPENAGRDLAFPEAFAPIIETAYPEIEPLSLKASPEVVYSWAVQVATQEMVDWELTREDAASGELEGVATTKVFRFQDDFVVRVEDGEDGGSVVRMRSRSRVGRSDLGANARRIRQFLEALAGKGQP